MKGTASILALLLPAISARFVQDTEGDHVQLHPEIAEAEKFQIELAPGETRWVTDEEKWELRRNGQRFFDITATPDIGYTLRSQSRPAAVFPTKLSQQDAVKPLLKTLSKEPMQQHLITFSGFHTRYFRSDYGRQSSEWLLSQVNKTIVDAGAHEHGVSVNHFEHSWGQNSIIATIPGQSKSTIVVGAHQDSVNLYFPSLLAAPGADDDGSGTVTTLEALRVLLTSEDFAKGKLQNTVEFHWYSAEEGGLLGSQAIFSTYEKQKRDIKAMLQQDMTGFVQRTLDAGKPESVGVITDFVDPGLTEFIKTVIDEYCDIPYVETKCGYACSDHASASKAGYPSSFVIESSFDLSSPHIHTTSDVIKSLSFDHMLQHAKMTTAFVYELASTDFKKLEKESQGMGEL